MRLSLIGCAAAGLTLLVSIPGCIIVATDHPDGERLSAAEAANVKAYSKYEKLPTVRDRYADEFAQLRPGMSEEEFKGVFKTATFVQQKQTDQGTVNAYSVTINERARYTGSRYAFTQSDEVWFYFKDNQFVKWGRANEWP